MPTDDYIKRSDALGELYRNASAKDPMPVIAYRVDLCERIEKIPAADVEPVRHGRWIPHPGHHDFDLCSVCRTGTRRRIYEDGGEIEYNYKICPWCGAKLEE